MSVPTKNPPKQVATRGRNFCFTINFAEKNSVFFRLLDPEKWAHVVSYCVYQLECGAEGTLHYQGYLECIGKQSFAALHLLEGLETAHFELRRGTGPQAIAYCKKQDETFIEGPWEWGEPKAPGSRTDLYEIQQKIHDGVSLKQIAIDHYASFIRHHKSFREYKRIVTTTRTFKSRVFLFIGPPGKGKSTIMKLIASRIGSVYKAPQPKGSGWYFDDYDGEDVFMIDEFDGNVCKPTFFNYLCDEHECVIPVHGGAGHQMVSKTIFIGTNYLPRQWWKNRNAAQLLQTTRRIDVVFKMGFDGVERWDHSGFQEFGPNINRKRRARPGDMYGLPPLDGG